MGLAGDLGKGLTALSQSCQKPKSCVNPRDVKGCAYPQERDKEMEGGLLITAVVVDLRAKNWTLGIFFSDLAGKPVR